REAGGVPRADRVEGAGGAAGLTVGRPQLERAERLGPEVLVAHDPGPAHLRIHLQPEALAEGAVPVHPHAGREEVPVADVEDVLEEEPGVPDLLAILVPRRVSGRAHGRLRGAREVLTP